MSDDSSKKQVRLPERLSYRIKNKLLGPPINSDRLQHERLNKKTALAVFASDNLSSSAYATEEILRVLIKVIGVAAFALVVPITVAMLVVLAFLILSYRQTIKAYPSSGGAYVVTRENFGLLAAQVAGVALLTDYILTVAVSSAAGTAALTSLVPELAHYTLPIAVFFVVIIAYGNLRGIKESGKVFALPTYFFILNMFVLIGYGAYRAFAGSLVTNPINQPGHMPLGSPSDGIFYGATLYVVLHAFASGGTAVTGVEAISNGVSAFKEPAWKNARKTLVVMGTSLGIMFLGLSFLASKTHPVPREAGTPTVISQIGTYVYGNSDFGNFMHGALQIGTMLILVLAANTSFADFPRLASFHAGDNFMPKQLTKRGHRLVFSNGILLLATCSVVLLLATGARVEHLIPLYAIGVFTSFTLSQAGMTKHHWRLREPGWKRGIAINGVGTVLTALVLAILAITKFSHGAWAVLVVVPIAIYLFVRLNKQYEKEDEELEKDVQRAAEQKLMRRHAVLVFVDELNVAAARAMQYGRTLNPDELRAIHFDLDPLVTGVLTDRWTSLGLTHFPLDIIECPDRRLSRAALEVVLDALSDEVTEVTVLIPRLEYEHAWHRFLHDQSAKRISKVLDGVPHCNVTIVPYVFGSQTVFELSDFTNPEATAALLGNGSPQPPRSRGARAISDATSRERVTLEGTVHSMRVQPWAGVAALECILQDNTGRISVVFIGRRQIAGITVGARIRVTGVIGTHERHQAMLNPAYELLSTPAVTSDHS